MGCRPRCLGSCAAVPVALSFAAAVLFCCSLVCFCYLCSVALAFTVTGTTLFCKKALLSPVKSLSFFLSIFLFSAGVIFSYIGRKSNSSNFCCLNHGRRALPHAGQEAAVSSGTCRAYPRCVLNVMWKKLLAAMLVTRAA